MQAFFYMLACGGGATTLRLERRGGRPSLSRGRTVRQPRARFWGSARPSPSSTDQRRGVGRGAAARVAGDGRPGHRPPQRDEPSSSREGGLPGLPSGGVVLERSAGRGPAVWSTPSSSVWITPDRQLEPGITGDEVRVSAAGDAWLERPRWRRWTPSPRRGRDSRTAPSLPTSPTSTSKGRAPASASTAVAAACFRVRLADDPSPAGAPRPRRRVRGGCPATTTAATRGSSLWLGMRRSEVSALRWADVAAEAAGDGGPRNRPPRQDEPGGRDEGRVVRPRDRPLRSCRAGVGAGWRRS